MCLLGRIIRGERKIIMRGPGDVYMLISCTYINLVIYIRGHGGNTEVYHYVDSNTASFGSLSTLESADNSPISGIDR